MDQYSKLFAEARAFILACYTMSDCAALNVARVQVWTNKMKRSSMEPPKLFSLPPTEAERMPCELTWLWLSGAIAS